MHKKICCVVLAAQEQQIPYEDKDEISKTHEMVN